MKETIRLCDDGDIEITWTADTAEDGRDLKELALEFLRTEGILNPEDEEWDGT